jgi:elongation factor Ts
MTAMTITASQVKELRDSTGVGMMECKKALTECQGNMEKALLWLRERGLSRAAQKSDRVTAEGLVHFEISPSKHEAVVLEVNCETDFSGKNDEFKKFVKDVAALALTAPDVAVKDIASLSALPMAGSTVGAQLVALIAKVGENMSLRRIKRVKVENGFIVGYNHMQGKIGTLVAFSGKVEGEKAEKAFGIGADLAMHVAAASPRYMQREEVAAGEVEQEKELARKKMRESGKPEDIIEKAIMGQVNKFYGEICFLEQPFVKDPKVNVGSYVKQSGLPITVSTFVRFQLGEGIEVKKTNFADEVAAQLK